MVVAGRRHRRNVKRWRVDVDRVVRWTSMRRGGAVLEHATQREQASDDDACERDDSNDNFDKGNTDDDENDKVNDGRDQCRNQKTQIK